MKEDQRQKRGGESLSLEMLFRRNPVPFGDVRKYYYAGMIGTVIFLAICFYVSFASIVLRTDSCVQIPNGVVIILLLCAGLNIVGHYSRTIVGYGLSAFLCLVVVLVLQLYNGGIVLKSNLPEYGEAVKDGVKGLDFWILLAKAMAVMQLILSVVFINSAVKVKEEPPAKGINIKIQQFRDRFVKKNVFTSLGWRPTEFWVSCACLILWMLVAQENPFETGKYDYIAMLLVLLGAALVFIGKSYFGSLCLVEGFLTCCTMYQLRFGWSVPVVAAYLGVWLSLLFLVIEAYRSRVPGDKCEWSIHFGKWFRVWIHVFPEKGARERKIMILRTICVAGASSIAVFMFPIHEFLSGFSGSYMNRQKDNLPLYFFLPIVMLVCVWGGTAVGYFCSAVVSMGLFNAIYDMSLKFSELFLFNSNEQHGFIGESLTTAMNRYTFLIECLSLMYFAVCMVTAIKVARRSYGRTEETRDN